jgi:CDP-diglyceride synthetase
MLKPERILLAILGSTSMLTAVALVIVVLAAGGLAFRQAGAPGQAERTFRAAGTLCFAAFLTGVACAALSVWYLIQQHHTVYVVVVVFFVLQLALLTLAAVRVFTQMISNRRQPGQRGADASGATPAGRYEQRR